MNLLTHAWLGYEISHDRVEEHLFVKLIRQEGLEKPTTHSTDGVTIAHFVSIDVETLGAELAQIQSHVGSMGLATLRFTGYGMIDSDKGSYVYLSPELSDTLPPEQVKRALEETAFYDQDLNCRDLHLSIGGADPGVKEKPSQRELPEPLEVRGHLVLTGKQGEHFVQYIWSDEEKTFRLPDQVPPTSSQAHTPQVSRPTSAPLPIHTIAIYPKIQADTATAVYLVQKYGQTRYPGIDVAKIVFWNRLPETESPEEAENQGTLLLDLGGRYDHHVTNKSEGKRSECLSTIIAKDLGIEQNPELKKILAWAKRDDLEGKGTISADALDRAFGLSGIIMNFNRLYRDRLGDALAIITEILSLHVQEEYKRTVEIPQEWNALVASGDIRLFEARQGSAILQCCSISSGNTSFPGFAKAAKKMDLVIQRSPAGHTNIITQQLRSLDLRPVIAGLRQAERAALGMPSLPHSSTATGTADDVPVWYYDDAANTIQNGGIDPQGLPATKLPLDTIIQSVKANLQKGVIGSLKRDKEAGTQR